MASEQQPEQQISEVPEVIFTTEAEALAGRTVGLAHYNANELEHALATQVGVIKFFANIHGENSSKMGLYYLDYGLTLLATIQGRDKSAEDAALTAVDDEDAEYCFDNLDLARVCFEKAEEEDPGNVEIKFRVVEVHDALAQLQLEKDDSQGALTEFEHALLLLRDITPTPEFQKKHSQAIASALFDSGRCYMQEADYAGACDKLKECIDFIATLPAGTINADLIEEVNLYYADAMENRDQKTHEKVTAAIKELYPDDKQDLDAGNAPTITNPNLSALPGGEERGSTNSMLLNPIVMLPGRENSNSTSRSVFPMQGTGERSRSAFSQSNGPVNIAVAKKKEKPVVEKPELSGHEAGEPAAKKNRTEAPQ